MNIYWGFLLKEMVGERRMTDNQEAEKALKKLK